MRQALLFALIFVWLPYTCIAGTIKGTITDERGVALPYATVYVQGTTVGVSASADGNYQLQLNPGTYKIICSFVGYKQSAYNVTIVGAEVKQHNFSLADQSLEMKEVVVHASAGEDPAYAIIRNVIARRRYHQEQIRSFHTGIYFKGVMRSRKLPSSFMGQKLKPSDIGADSSGKGIIYLAEEDADYYSRGGKDRTIIHSVKESGDPNGWGFARFPSVISFYDNNLNLTGKDSRGFISPISDNALNYYKYHLDGHFEEQGHTIYKIKVLSKRLYEPTFYGEIYIVDKDFAVHSIDVTLTTRSNLDLLDTLNIKQVYLPFEKDNWVIKNQVLYYAIKLLGFDVIGSGVAVYDNQNVNEEIPDDIFNDKLISSYDKTATKKDTSYWVRTRPVPLELDENRDYTVKDSMYKKTQTQEYKDSVRLAQNKLSISGVLVTGSNWKSRNGVNSYHLNPLLLGMVGFNPFEGAYLAPKLEFDHLIDTGKHLRGAVAARYGFHNHHFNPIARVDYVTEDKDWKKRSWTAGVEGGEYVFQFNPDNPVLPEFNTISALLYGENDLKIYERAEVSAHVARNYGNGLKWDVSFSYQQRIPYDSTGYNYSWGKPVAGYTETIAPHLKQVTVWEKNDAAIAHLAVSYQPGYRYIMYPDYKTGSSKLPVFSLVYDKGIPGIVNSVSDFDKWKFTITHDFRIPTFGNVSYNIGAGGFLNTDYVSAPDLMHLYGNRGIGYASPYLRSFQFAQYYAFSNKEPLYGEAHIEYNLKGLLSDRIPLLRTARWNFLIGTNTFYARQSDYYTEAFIGVDNLGFKKIRIFRVDFVQSWDSYGGHNSGFRFGINTHGLIAATLGEASGEW